MTERTERTNERKESQATGTTEITLVRLSPLSPLSLPLSLTFSVGSDLGLFRSVRVGSEDAGGGEDSEGGEEVGEVGGAEAIEEEEAVVVVVVVVVEVETFWGRGERSGERLAHRGRRKRDHHRHRPTRSNLTGINERNPENQSCSEDQGQNGRGQNFHQEKERRSAEVHAGRRSFLYSNTLSGAARCRR